MFFLLAEDAGRINLNRSVSPLVQRVVSMIEEGYLNDHTVRDLADQLRVSGRCLRKAFLKKTGLTPSRLATYHRGTIAKRLLSETSIPVTDIAYISGFGSVRQFNQVMRDMYQTAPTESRSSTTDSKGVTTYTRMISNAGSYELPATGGPGTDFLYRLGSMLFMSAGAGFILLGRKKRAA